MQHVPPASRENNIERLHHLRHSPAVLIHHIKTAPPHEGPWSLTLDWDSTSPLCLSDSLKPQAKSELGLKSNTLQLGVDANLVQNSSGGSHERFGGINSPQAAYIVDYTPTTTISLKNSVPCKIDTVTREENSGGRIRAEKNHPAMVYPDLEQHHLEENTSTMDSDLQSDESCGEKGVKTVSDNEEEAPDQPDKPSSSPNKPNSDQNESMSPTVKTVSNLPNEVPRNGLPPV